ncbi:MAG: acetyl-CoA carboxylase biotin carboxyl carrier protein subunit [Clostridium sp.]|nr:acetyl-CoA carboxylase biotin carboxyl carrier protein subunit [Clostridium sp.]
MKEYTYNINGTDYRVNVEGIENNVATVSVNGETYLVKLPVEETPTKRPVVVKPAAEAAPSAKKYSVKAPLPGVIVEVTVKVGDEVKRGDTVAVLDAMKMENNIASERAGRVAQICVEPGLSVMEGTDLIVFE